MKKLFAVIMMIGLAVAMGAMSETNEQTMVDNNEQVEYLGYKDIRLPKYYSK